MRYFRYKNTDKNREMAWKAQYKAVTKNQKRIIRKARCWESISSIATVLIFVSCLVGGCFLMESKMPQPDGWFLRLLVGLCKLALGMVLVVASGGVTVVLTMPLWKKLRSFSLPAMKQEIFAKACKHLRDYYGLREPYLITKCFDATDKKFRSHDVCLFVVGEELRLTTDLVHGFLNGERDLGCYAMKQGEFTLSGGTHGERPAVMLKTGHLEFLLGYRAKGFIEKQFPGTADS